MIKILQFPVRIVVCVLAYIFYLFEYLYDIPKRKEATYVRHGECKKCGRCCRVLALELPENFVKRGWIIKLLTFYHKFCFNFNLLGLENKWLIYKCGYLTDGEKVKCKIYPFRHRLCRLYPDVRYVGRHKTHLDCGFRFVRIDGKPTFDDVLGIMGGKGF